MTAITLHLDPATEARLRQAADELDCSPEEFAAEAIRDQAREYFRSTPADDPGRVQLIAGATLHDISVARSEVAR